MSLMDWLWILCQLPVMRCTKSGEGLKQQTLSFGMKWQHLPHSTVGKFKQEMVYVKQLVLYPFHDMHLLTSVSLITQHKFLVHNHTPITVIWPTLFAKPLLVCTIVPRIWWLVSPTALVCYLISCLDQINENTSHSQEHTKGLNN